MGRVCRVRRGQGRRGYVHIVTAPYPIIVVQLASGHRRFKSRSQCSLDRIPYCIPYHKPYTLPSWHNHILHKPQKQIVHRITHIDGERASVQPFGQSCAVQNVFKVVVGQSQEVLFGDGIGWKGMGMEEIVEIVMEFTKQDEGGWGGVKRGGAQ